MKKRILSLVLTSAVMLLISGFGGYDSCVYAASKPGDFTVSASNFTTNDDVVINWSSASGADHYGLSVWKPPYGGDWDLVFDQSVSGASQNIGKLPAGKYRVHMAAYNSAGLTLSNYMYFDVAVPPVQAPKVATPAPIVVTNMQNNPSTYVRIKNRWTGKYLHEENKTGLVQYGDIQSGWLSAQWSIENKDGFVRIKNRWTGDYMNIESNKGSVQLSAIKDGWQSASWTMENVEGYTRFKNQWKQTYINTERKTGSAECNKIASTAWSSQWTIEVIGSEMQSQQLQTTGNISARNKAVEWTKAQADKTVSYDVDGLYGNQCSDFATAYINYLIDGDAWSKKYTTYNGYQYFDISYPAGWQKIENSDSFVPEPGDILIFNGTSKNPNGHVCVAVSGCTATRYKAVGESGSYPTRGTHYQEGPYFDGWNQFRGVIRPIWK